MNHKKVTIAPFYDLFRNYEWQKGHNFPILWPLLLWITQGHNLKRSCTTFWMTQRVAILWTTKLNGLEELFDIIFSLFKWEILFSHIFAPLFSSFHYNRKWLHFEFHFDQWTLKRQNVLKMAPVVHKKVTIVTFISDNSHLDLDLKRLSQLWPFSWITLDLDVTCS